jgi:hypothetical protein
VQLRVAWGGVDELPVLAANQFLVQVAAQTAPPDDPGEIVLTVGHLAPPLLLGNQDEVQKAAAELGIVHVRPLARFSVPRSQAAALVKALNTVLGVEEPHGE